MTEIEDFVIQNPYGITQDDQSLIKKASPAENHADDWETGCLSQFKKRAKDYYLKVQSRYCAYCRTKIRTSQAPAEIEHIVPKSDYPEWMYEPFNLCVSCKCCNTTKSTKPVLKPGKYTRLPRDSRKYILVHPHLDKYSRHIKIVEGFIYRGLSKKGRETIRICGLDRLDLAVDRAEDKVKEDKTLDERRMLNLLELNGRPLEKCMESLKERIHEICVEYNRV